jgi:hypothetical protein
MITRLSLIAGMALLAAPTAERKTFSTAEEARDALVTAAAKGLDAVRDLFGTQAGDIVRTGDEVQDKALLSMFNKLAAEKAMLESEETSPDRRTLILGVIEWPFAVPLTRSNGRWSWDIAEGKAEIRRRIIGRNELSAIEICRGYVAAQDTYSETDWDGNAVFEYAGKIISTEGKKDGLYWPGEDSPLRRASRTQPNRDTHSATAKRPSRTTDTISRSSPRRDLPHRVASRIIS